MLLRQSAIYAVGNTIQAALAIFLIAIYTRLMTADEFGAYAFVLTSVQFAYQLIMNWICVSFVRLYHKVPNTSMLLGTYLGLFGIVTLGGLLITFGMLPFMSTREQAELAILGYFFFVAMAWMELNMRVYQARLEAGRQARARILRSVVTAIVGGGLTWYGWGPHGALIGAIVGMAGIGLVQSVREWSNSSFGGDRATRREVRRFGMPLAVSFAVGATSVFAGRYMIAALESAAVLGIYVISVEMAGRIAGLSIGPIASASASITYSDLREKGVASVRARLRHTCIMMLGLVVPGVTGLAIVSPDIAATLVGEAFQADTALLLPIVGFALFAQTFRAMYLDQALHLGLRSDRLLWSSAASLIVSLIANYYLISAFGLIGAAYASLLVAGLGVILVAMLGRVAFPLPFPMREALKIAVATAIMAVGVLAMPIEHGALGLVAKVLIGSLIYFLAVIALDIGDVRQFIRRYYSE